MNIKLNSASEIASYIYRDIVEGLNMGDECLNFLVDGTVENTMRGQAFLDDITRAIENALDD